MSIEISKELCKKFYKTMKTIQVFKENVIQLVKNNEIRGITRICFGEEAIATGVCGALKSNDVIINTYYGYSNLIAKGSNPKYIFAELFGRVDGYNKGIRGNINISVPEVEIYGANSIVDSGAVIAIGFALASKIKKKETVAVAFYSDETANEGILHEAMNISSAFSLPVVFICQNNQCTRNSSIRTPSKVERFSERAKAYGISSLVVNGNDVLSVYKSVKELFNDAREKNCPAILECITYYYMENLKSNMGSDTSYGKDKDLQMGKEKLPIIILQKKLLENCTCSQEELDEIDIEVNNQMKEAVEFARNSKIPKPEDALKYMYARGYENIPKMGWS